MKEFWKRMVIPFYNTKAVAKSIKEHGLVKGIAEDMKDLAREAPITSSIYKMGKYEGKIDGYNEASNEFELKILKQAEEFETKKRSFMNAKEEYIKLLIDYETYISQQERIISQLSKEKLELLNQIKNKYIDLKNLMDNHNIPV